MAQDEGREHGGAAATSSAPAHGNGLGHGGPADRAGQRRSLSAAAPGHGQPPGVAAAAGSQHPSSSSPAVASVGSGKKLILHSPVGAESAEYSWPLKKGKGSMRRSEDKHDEAEEILTTIRYVCEDFPAIKRSMEGIDLVKYDAKNFASMEAICKGYNKAVKNFREKTRDDSSHPGDGDKSGSRNRVSRPHLRHILQKCYNKSVKDPNELNNYEAFTPEVYGETSFELICQILDKLHPILGENKFVDLGSGVGQVVLQVAALTNCSISLGIEKANTPATYAEDLERHFKFWMAFYGKVFSPFKLVHGDFLDQQHREEILQSTIVFVNNFAFGPEVDQRLKDIFADLGDGARIFSSKSFCALNFRITDRNLSDIGTIMHVSKMDPLKGSVSWTGKPVSYFLHIIDRAKLERYFQRNQANRQGESDTGGRRRGRARGHRGLHDKSGSASGTGESTPVENGTAGGGGGGHQNGESSCDSRDVSRASSVDRDDSSNSAWPPINASTAAAAGATGQHAPSVERQNSAASSINAVSREYDDYVAVISPPEPLARRKQSRRAGSLLTNKRLKQSIKRLNEEDDQVASNRKSSDGAEEPSAPATAAAAAAGSDEQSSSGVPPAKKKKGRPRKLAASVVRENNERIAGGIAGLDALHAETIKGIQESVNDATAPAGCIAERLSQFAPRTVLEHEELATSLRSDGEGGHIPHQLQTFLESVKRQYLEFTRTMQDPEFKTRVEADIDAEKRKRVDLQKRERQLKAQIDNLIADSLGLLRCRLGELGITARNSPEFIEKAKGIVCNHHDLQRKKSGVETEIRQLEADTDRLIRAKEAELTERLARERPGMAPAHIKDLVRRELDHIMSSGAVALPLQSPSAHHASPPTGSVAPLLNKLSDVTFTKCSGEAGGGAPGQPSGGGGGTTTTRLGGGAELITTQVRKRGREPQSKQRDWPEKRSRLASSGDWPPSGATVVTASPEKDAAAAAASSPEAVARRLSLSDHHKTSAATLTISPTKANSNIHHNPPQQSPSFPLPSSGAPVEVRKMEPTSSYAQLHQQGYPPRSSPQKSPAPTSSGQRLSAVDLPKVDLSASMHATSSTAGPTAASHPHHQHEPLVLPPHPDSRSRSSEQDTAGDDNVGFGKSKVSSTPRAEQFEDRLKTIIHSVLSSDADADAPKSGGRGHGAGGGGAAPPPPLPPPRELQQQQQHQPMFSPVKRELPASLPPPPTSHGGPMSIPPQGPMSSRPMPPPMPSHHGPPHPTHQPGAPPLPPAGSLPAPPPPPPGAVYHPMPPRSSPSSYVMHQQQQQQQQHAAAAAAAAAYRQQQEHHRSRRLPSPHSLPPAAHHGGPPPSSHLPPRSMHDLISSEVERNLSSSSHHRPHPSATPPGARRWGDGPPHPPPPHHPASSHHRMPPSSHHGDYPGRHLPPGAPPQPYPGPAHHRGGGGGEPPPSMARMSQVIEDSIRGGGQPPPHLPPLSRDPSPGARRPSSGGGVGMHHAQSLESLRDKTPPGPPLDSHGRPPLDMHGRPRLLPHPPPPPPPPSESPVDHARPSSRPRSNEYPAMEGLAARFGPYMAKAAAAAATSSSSPPPPPPSSRTPSGYPHHDVAASAPGFKGRVTPTGSSSGSAQPPLPSPPVLPPKKQHLNDYRLPGRDYHQRPHSGPNGDGPSPTPGGSSSQHHNPHHRRERASPPPPLPPTSASSASAYPQMQIPSFSSASSSGGSFFTSSHFKTSGDPSRRT